MTVIYERIFEIEIINEFTEKEFEDRLEKNVEQLNTNKIYIGEKINGFL